MALNAKSFKLIEAQTPQSQRLRFMLAKLYGADMDVEMRGFLLQADEEEMTCWMDVQRAFYVTKGDNLRLKNLAEKAKIEYQTQQAFEEGRSFAYDMLPALVADKGVTLRESKNPYLKNDSVPPEVAQAWTAGFQNAFEVIAGESW